MPLNHTVFWRFQESNVEASCTRHSGFGSLHATALAIKMRQQSDWTWKNYLFNIDCRWLGPVSVYLQTRISCFTRLPIISSLSTGCSLTQDMGRDWHQHIPCLVMPIFYSQGYIYSENLYDLSNPQCSFPPGYHHGLCSQNKLPNLPCAHYIWHYMMEHLCVCLVHVWVVLMYFGRQ